MENSNINTEGNMENLKSLSNKKGRDYFISNEEFESFIKLFKPNQNKYVEIIKLVYYEGYKVGDAIRKIGLDKTQRALQATIKRKSIKIGKEFNLRDLKLAYILNNPKQIYKRLTSIKRIRKPLPARLRWQILCRDDFKCKSCGLTSEETILNVDHIIPISKGGKNEEDNLRTLCSLCNMGKSDKIIKK